MSVQVRVSESVEHGRVMVQVVPYARTYKVASTIEIHPLYICDISICLLKHPTSQTSHTTDNRHDVTAIFFHFLFSRSLGNFQMSQCARWDAFNSGACEEQHAARKKKVIERRGTRRRKDISEPQHLISLVSHAPPFLSLETSFLIALIKSFPLSRETLRLPDWDFRVLKMLFEAL